MFLDSDGTVLATGIGGAANGTYVGNEVAKGSVSDAVLDAVPAAPMTNVKAVGACSMIWYATEEVLKGMGFSGHYSFYSEGELAFRRAGLYRRWGVAVIAGTGSSHYAYDGEKMVSSLGGWGMAIGDEGSGFDIGLKVLKAAGRSKDGRGPATMLLDLALQFAGAQSFREILRLHCYPCPTQRGVASFARLATEAAKAGDEVAISILREAGTSLGDDAVHLAKRVFSPEDTFDVALSGGVFNSGDLVVVPLRERVLAAFPKAVIHLSKMSAGEAAARLALEGMAK